MEVVVVECPNCGRTNQIPGSDIELLDLPGSSFRACYGCDADLDFSSAKVEVYQATNA